MKHESLKKFEQTRNHIANMNKDTMLNNLTPLIIKKVCAVEQKSDLDPKLVKTLSKVLENTTGSVARQLNSILKSQKAALSPRNFIDNSFIYNYNRDFNRDLLL